jgi:1-acyl-sn-glycerol-3-phosphate acyltransferase
MNFYKFAKTITNRFFRIFFRVKVIGSENEPTEGPFLVCSNHLSNNDVLLLGTSFHHQVRFFAKKELFAVPILKQLITSLGAFPVDRQNAAASFSSIKNAVSLLKGGEVVGYQEWIQEKQTSKVV